MPNILRGKKWFAVVLLVLLMASATRTQAQVCTGFPSILALGSSKNPNKLCSPVTANLTYNVTFASPTPGAGTLQIEYNWDDGSAPEVFNLPNGQNTYNHNRNHTFPTNSDCEFNVVITLIYNGTRCASTRQVQKVASWRTDAFNGGNVRFQTATSRLIGGVTVHEVCYGQDINVVFNDVTTFNCNQNYVHAPGPLPVETPNTENRWQHIRYNTPIGGAKIPNVFVNGVAITNAAGGDLPGRANYNDTRGVFYMPSPVLVTTPRRQALAITADGGFGPGFPQVGQEFEVTLRYWNFCNPYDDPNIPGGPADPINGDNAPVEQIALIRIVNAPVAPTAATQAPVCYGTNPSAFSVTGVPANNIVTWYRNTAGAPGAVIASGNGMTSLPITSHPNWVNNTVAGVFEVWATYRPNIAGSLNCESPPVKVTRTLRERPVVPAYTIATDELCNGSTFTVTMPPPAAETVGGATQYTWTGSSGVSIASTNATSATFDINVTFAPGETFVDRTVTVSRRFTSNPNCSRSTTIPIRVFRPTVAGTPSASPDICETTPVGSISLSGHIGDIVRWEVQKDGGGFVTYTGPASGNSITPGLLTDGVYQFRAVVQNAAGGPCAIATSGAEQVTISDNPDAADAGADQGICTLGPVPPTITSAAIGANAPTSGSGKWTVVATLPLGRPLPTFLPNDTDPNAQIRINSADAGAYTLRWTVTSGVCTSFDDVIIDFGADPTDPAAGPNDAVCGEAYTLQGNAPLIGFGKWTVVSGPGACAGAGCPLTIANDEIATSQVSLNAPFVYGAYTLQWTVTSGGAGCNVEQDQVTITFDQPATITSAADIYAGCLDPAAFTPINLTGDFGGGAVNGHWEVVAGAGMLGNGTAIGADDASNPATDAYTPTLADYTANDPIDLKFVARPAVGSSCPAVEEAVLITFDPKPVANAGTNIGNICGDQVSLDAQSPAPFSASGVWSSPDATLQFFSSVDQVTPDNTDPKAVVKNLKLGANTVTWTLTYTNAATLATCVSDPASITVTRVAPPTPVNLDVFECEIAPAGGAVVTNITLTNYENNVTALTAAQRQITWFRDGPPPAGTLVASPGNAQLNVVDNQLYVARIRELATNCISDAQVTVHVRPLAPAINSSAALCEDTPGSGTVSNIDLTQAFYVDKVTGGAPGLDVHWFSTLFDAQSNTFEITAPFNMSGNTRVFARVTYSAPTATAPACPDFAALDLIINTIPTGAVINGDPTVCMGESGANINDLPIYTYQVTSIPGATYNWNVPQGAGEFVQFGGGGVNDFFVILKFPFTAAPPVLNISVNVVLNSCSSAAISLPIQREEVPGSPVIVGPDDVCQDISGQSYTIGTPSPSSDYIWNITKQSDGTNGGAFIIAGQGQDEIFVDFTNEPVVITVKEQNAVCAGPEVDYPVAVNLYPTMQASNPSICSDSQTGIVFTPDALSVPVDHYDILSVSTTAGINFVNPPGPAGPVAQNNVGTNAIQTHVFENLQAVPLTVNYTVQPVSVNGNGLNCPGPSKIFIVNVLPEPQLDPNLSKNVCSDELSNILLLSASGTFPADGFIINSINVPAGVTPTDPNFLLITDGTPKPGTIMQGHAYVNTTSSNQVVAYTVSPHSSTLNGPIGCTGNPPTTVNITVHPRTIVDQINTATPICNGDLIDVMFGATGNADATFLWSVKSFDPILTLNSPASGTGNIVDMNVTNSSQTLPNGIINLGVRAKNTAIEETATGCINPEVLFQVEIRPSPVAQSQLLVPACSDAPGGSIFTADLETLIPSITPIADVTSGDVAVRWFDGDPNVVGTTEITAPALNAFPMQTNILFVTVTNVNTSCTKVVQASYDVKPNIGFTLSKTDVKCASESNGQVNVLVTSGNPNYLYSIKVVGNPDEAPVSSAANSHQFKFLAGDINYEVKVESQSNPGCLMRQTIVIDQPDPLSVVIPTNPIKQEISCFGLADGIIEASASGGTPPYQFTLSNTGQSNNNGEFINLSAGTYLVFVKDKNGAADGCPASASVTIDDPDPVIIRNMVAPVNALGFQLGCNSATDGQIDFVMEDVGGLGNNQTGVENFTYELLLNNAPHAASPLISAARNGSFTGLGAGNYQLIARDIKNCASSPKFVVIVNPPPFDPGVVGNPMSACDGVKPADLFQIAPPFGGLGNFDFEWQVSLDGVGGWTPADPVGNNDKNASFAFDAAGLTYDPLNPRFFYRRQVITAPGVGTCPPAFSNVVEVKVNPTPIAIGDAVSPMCEGSTGGQGSLTLAQGTYPVRYDYEIFDANPVVSLTGLLSNNLGGDPGTLTPANVFIPPSVSTSGDIFLRFTNIRDANGCAAANPPDATIVVIPVNANFTLSDTDICSGESIDVSWNRDNDLDYALTFGDGEQRGFPFGNGDVNPQTETKVYINNSPSNVSTFQVTLKASYLAGTPSGCEATTFQTVKVQPTALVNLLPGDDELCSGEFFEVRDRSLGVTGGQWTMQEGANPPVTLPDAVPGDLSQQMFNTSVALAANPTSYTFTYEPVGGTNCPVTPQSFTVNVYAMPVASFTASDATPEYVGGQAQVTFTNTSSPFDPSGVVLYEWDKGEVGATVNETGADRLVTYFTKSNKTVTLTATNTANDECETRFNMLIDIDVPGLAAAFNVTPRFACVPVTIATDNLSAGADRFEWDLVTPNNNVETTTVNEPSWTLTSPGVYTIRHRAGVIGDPTMIEATPIVVEVYESPFAQFEIFLNQAVYIGTEVRVSNGTIGADNFSWNFGDHPESENKIDFQPTYAYTSEGNFDITLTAFKDYGPKDQDGDGIADGNVVCSDVAVRPIFVRPGGSLKIPNAFTPNESNSEGGAPGDGTTNDFFLPIMDGVEEFTMQIFDRWGTLVFESRNKNQGWNGYDRNGRLMPAGVYVYKVVLRLTDNSRTTKIGDVTLIR